MSFKKYLKYKEDISTELNRCLNEEESIIDNCFRYGSESFFDLIKESRKLKVDDSILDTDIGEFAMYEGKYVPLDLPLYEEEDEEEYDDINESKNVPLNKKLWDKAISQAKKKFDVYPSAYANAWAAKWYKSKGGKWEKKVSEGKKGLDDKGVYPDSGLGKWAKEDWVDVSRKNKDGSHPSCGRKDADEKGYPKCRPSKSASKMTDKEKESASRRKREVENKDKDNPKGDKPNMVKTMKESEEKKELNKPMRNPNSKKKYMVYVKDGDKIKKVSFGDSTGLTIKYNDPEARKSFVARHDCANKKDKTTAGYWSCRSNRYWKSLNLAKPNGSFPYW